jgi:D-alanine-D-alanine ligase
MRKSSVGVLRGGPSSEYDVSLMTGSHVIKHMPENWAVRDIFIDRDGRWHMDGVEKEPSRILPHLDSAFIAMHGEYGEDGRVQKILETFNVPFNGSSSLQSALAMNKVKTKEILALHGVHTPKFTYLKKQDYSYGDLSEIFASFPRPFIVKPATGGSSLGVSIGKSFEDLVQGVSDAFKSSSTVLIEEYIKGAEATCGVLDHLNGQDLYALYPIEIKCPDESEIWDYENKYSNDHTLICPASFNMSTKQKIQDIAHKVHSVMSLRDYSRSDFMVTDDGEIYFLEVNTLPGLTENSLYPLALNKVGIQMSEFLDHVLTLALNRK